jgi:hypothetical protein
MDERSRAVLTAVDRWMSAAQSMTAADEEQRRTEDQQLDLDDAEIALAAAVLAWRAAGRID